MPKGKTRWRISFWNAANPTGVRRIWHYEQCKLCACDYAYALADAMAQVDNLKTTDSQWTLARIVGHLTEPTIVCNSGSISRHLAKRHAH